jgi:HK97 family phage major capsid protein
MPNDNKYDELLDEMKLAATAIRNKAESKEIARQRATLPYHGIPAPDERRNLNLGSEDKAFLSFVRGKASPSELKALVLDEVGQYMVSPTIEAEIERSLAKEVTIRPLASQRTIDKDRIQIRDITEASVAWGRLETGSEIPESDLTPGVPRFKYACDLYGLVKFGEDELEDNDFDLASILADSFSRAIAEKENAGFLVGIGWDAGQQPDGIILDATLLENAIPTAATSAITVEDMLDLIYACPKQFRKNGSFIVNSATELVLRKLRAGGSTTTDGPFLWLPAVALGMPNTFLGRPIYADDEMGTLDDTAAVIAIFGDFQRGYRILDRKGIGIQRLSELYAEAGLVGFKVHARVGGYLIRPSNKALVLLTEKAA